MRTPQKRTAKDTSKSGQKVLTGTRNLTRASGKDPATDLPDPWISGATSIEETDITDALSGRYRAYAEAVILDRALPDMRDGMKPSQRRLMHLMHEERYLWDAPFRKSARIVGALLGKYHPHGDASVYGTLARFAQPWSMSEKLIDGQGNFGSPDGDPPAAMRYTEARLAKLSKHIVQDIDPEVVPFIPNYDGQEQEPTVLPAEFPNLLVNGASGIAVGVASSIPPHNISEVIGAARARLKNPSSSLGDILKIMKGPDFPSGGVIVNPSIMEKVYSTGKGSVVVEARYNVETSREGPRLVYNETGPGISKPDLLGQINAIISDDPDGEIVSARDESGRQGTRFVVDLRKDADPAKIAQRLYQKTPLRSTVSISLTALDLSGRPMEMGLLTLLDGWIEFRLDTVRKRARRDLRAALRRGRVLVGRWLAIGQIDKIVKIIRESKDRSEAIVSLMETPLPIADQEDALVRLGLRIAGRRSGPWRLTEEQAEDILGMRLQRLTGMERDGLAKTMDEILALVDRQRALLASVEAQKNLVITELDEIVKEHGRERRTAIEERNFKEEAAVVEAEAPPAEMISIAITPDMRLRRMKARGRNIAEPGQIEMDIPSNGVIGLFTDKGEVVAINADSVGEDRFRAAGALRGSPVDGSLVAAHPLRGNEKSYVTFFKEGYARRNAADRLASLAKGKSRAWSTEGRTPACILQAEENDEVAVITSNGMGLRFAVNALRIMGDTTSQGVVAIALGSGEIISGCIIIPGKNSEEGPIEGKADKKSGKRKEKAKSTLGVVLDQNGRIMAIDLDVMKTARRGGKGVAMWKVNGGGKNTFGRAVATTEWKGGDISIVRNGQTIATANAESIQIGKPSSIEGIVVQEGDRLIEKQ